MRATTRSLTSSLTFWSLLALGAGLGLGIVGFSTGNEGIRRLATLVQPLGILWLRALRLVILPLVVLQLLSAISLAGDGERAERVGMRALLLIGLGSVAFVAVSFLVAWPLVGLYEVAPGTVETLRASVSAVPEVALGNPGAQLGGGLVGLVPTNIFQALAEGQIIQVILVTVVFGLAMNKLPANQRDHLRRPIEAMNQAVMVLVHWLLVATPIGVFALILVLALGTGLQAAGVVGAFVVMNQGLQLLLVLALYPISALWGNTSIRTFARAVLPVQVVALSTRASLATMPVQIETGEQFLRFGQASKGVVVPLCVTFFKVTLLITSPIQLVFLAKLFGVALAPAQVFTFAVTVLLLNFTELGLPRGGVPFRNWPAYLAVGIPIEGLVILQAMNDLEDYPDTVANATGMFAAATILSRGDRAAVPAGGSAPQALAPSVGYQTPRS